MNILIDVRSLSNPLALVVVEVVIVFYGINILIPVDAQQGSEELSHEVRQDGHTFDVKAVLTNDGSLTGIQVFPETGSILISIEAGSEDEPSELRIVLPRELIDAKDGDNDSEFFIIVEGEEAEYAELRATETEREIEIPIPGGATQVEIFGTHIVPEFPALVILLISIVVIIALSNFIKPLLARDL